MNRPRKKGFLVYTTSDDAKKQAIAERNKNACAKKEHKNIQCMMSVLGKQRQITLEEYFRLKKAGYNVDVIEK